MKIAGFKISKCPYCSQLYKNRIIASYNTLNSRYYSDGYIEGDFIPKMPSIIKCINSSCGIFFKIEEGKFVAEVGVEDFDNPKWNNAYYLAGYKISPIDLEEALSTDFCKDAETEKAIRVLLLRKYNDNIRYDKKQNFTPTVKSMFLTNIDRLIKLTKPEITAEKLFFAELYREKGDFASCERILKSLKTEKDNEKRIKEKIFSQAKVKDDKVFNIYLVAIKIEYKCDNCGDSHILFDLSKLNHPLDYKHFKCLNENRLFEAPSKIFAREKESKNTFVPCDNTICPFCGGSDVEIFEPEIQDCLNCKSGKYKIVDWFNK